MFLHRVFFLCYGYTSTFLGYEASYQIWTRIGTLLVYLRFGEPYGKYIIYKTMSIQVLNDVKDIDPRALNQNYCLGCVYFKKDGFWYYGNEVFPETKGLVRSL